MHLSLKIKIDEKKLKKISPNPIYEYAELIEVLREHGFVHQSPLDYGFINNDATEEQAKQAMADAFDRLLWLDEDMLTECRVVEVGETFDITFPFNDGDE